MADRSAADDLDRGGGAEDEVIDVEDLLASRGSDRRPSKATGGRSSADVAASATPRGRSAGPDARPRRRRLGVVAISVLLAAAATWVVVAYAQVSSVRDDLLAARAQLETAQDALLDGAMGTAADAFDQATATFDGVPERLGSPTVLPARAIPSYDRSLDAVAELSEGAAAVAGAGGEVAALLRGEEGGLGTLTPTDGRVPVDAIEDLHDALVRAATTLADARERVEAVPTSGIEPALIDARAEFLDVIARADELLPTATDVVGIIPPLLGADGPRRYVVIASNPTEARGTGGYFGAYTVADVEDGQLRFTDTGQLYDLQESADEDLSFIDPSLGARYNRYGGATYLPNINMTPDFPAAAQAVAQYLDEVVQTEVDGVLAIDPYGFEALLRIAGPVQVRGYGEVGADEVVEFVSRDAYAVITDAEERKRLIGEVAVATLQRFLQSPGDTDLGNVVEALSDVVRRESLLIHSTDPDEQAVIRDLGLAGAIGGDVAPDQGDLVAVMLNSGAPYKIDYFLRRTLDYEVALAEDGRARSTLIAGFENTVPPEGEVDYMVGFGEDPLQVGDALSFVSTYCRPGCEFVDVPPPGFQQLPSQTSEELGFGVSSSWLLTPAGQARQLAWTYETPDAWVSSGSDRIYRLTYDHQTTIIPVQVSLRVNVPAGYEVLRLPEGATVEEDVVYVAFSADADVEVEIAFTPATEA